jgi:hypothetical protein
LQQNFNSPAVGTHPQGSSRGGRQPFLSSQQKMRFPAEQKIQATPTANMEPEMIFFTKINEWVQRLEINCTYMEI